MLCAISCRGNDPTGRGSGPRALSLHDVTTEIAVELGALPALVGIAEPVDPSERVKRAVQHLPRVAGIESVLAARPRTLLGLGIVGEQDPELVRRARNAGIHVELADPASLADVAALVRRVGELLDRAPAAAELARKLEAETTQATTAARPLRVFVYDCCDPPFTAGGKTVLSELIRRAGGQNIFEDLPHDWTRVSWEAALARAPELLIIHAYQFDGQGEIPDKRRALHKFPTLASLPDVVLPLGEALGGIRSWQALARLQGAFRPYLEATP